MKRSDLPPKMRWIARLIFAASIVDVGLFIGSWFYLFKWFPDQSWSNFLVYVLMLGSSIFMMFMLKGAERQFENRKLVLEVEKLGKVEADR